MRIDVPQAALSFGFMNQPVGTHTSRTIMLSELTSLLEAVARDGSYLDYQKAAIVLNAVHKGSASTREKTFRHLRELYALSPDVAVFAGLRAVWQDAGPGRPLLAGICAVARDPLLRSTVDAILRLNHGQEITPGELAAAVQEAFPGQHGGTVTARIGRNVAASWKHAGLLEGRATKRRIQPQVTPATAAYALYLAHLCGARGDGLFSSLWARMLDTSISDLRTLASVAARQGWLEYRESGTVTDVTFRHFDSLGAGRQQ